jgi:hypothetical protein
MKIEARVYYEILKQHPNVQASDVAGFMTTKDYDAKVETIKEQISTKQEKDITTFIRTRNGKSKDILRQNIQDLDDIPVIIQEWADKRAFDSMLNNCLEYVYDKEVERGAV